MREPFVIVLSALADGQQIDLPDGHTWGMNDSGYLCVKMMTGDGDPVWFYQDIPFNSFVDLCAKLTEQQLVGISGATAVRKSI